MPSSVALVKAQKRSLIERHVRPNDGKALFEVFATLLPIALLWAAVPSSLRISYWVTALVVLALTLFLLRAFVVMHECGHGSLFRTARLNRAFGFLFGVVTGMPQYVWSQHHQFHHATNGNWARYRGPLNTMHVDDFAALDPAAQRRYEQARSLWLAPFGGFVYLLLNPRVNWLKGVAGLILHVVRAKIARPDVSLAAHAATFRTRYWSSPEEFRHMTANNVALFVLWIVMGWLVGPLVFAVCYVASCSLAGGAGIVLFTVQHNFEHAYASGTEGWDYDTAAILGTSFLVLPAWLNWMTVNIGYHHVHHLSARIPSYRLVDCHREYEPLFVDVKRLRLADIPAALRNILWDEKGRRIISIAEFRESATRSDVATQQS